MKLPLTPKLVVLGLIIGANVHAAPPALHTYGAINENNRAASFMIAAQLDGKKNLVPASEQVRYRIASADLRQLKAAVGVLLHSQTGHSQKWGDSAGSGIEYKAVLDGPENPRLLEDYKYAHPDMPAPSGQLQTLRLQLIDDDLAAVGEIRISRGSMGRVYRIDPNGQVRYDDPTAHWSDVRDDFYACLNFWEGFKDL